MAKLAVFRGARPAVGASLAAAGAAMLCARGGWRALAADFRPGGRLRERLLVNSPFVASAADDDGGFFVPGGGNAPAVFCAPPDATVGKQRFAAAVAEVDAAFAVAADAALPPSQALVIVFTYSADDVRRAGEIAAAAPAATTKVLFAPSWVDANFPHLPDLRARAADMLNIAAAELAELELPYTPQAADDINAWLDAAAAPKLGDALSRLSAKINAALQLSPPAAAPPPLIKREQNAAPESAAAESESAPIEIGDDEAAVTKSAESAAPATAAKPEPAATETGDNKPPAGPFLRLASAAAPPPLIKREQNAAPESAAAESESTPIEIGEDKVGETKPAESAKPEPAAMEIGEDKVGETKPAESAKPESSADMKTGGDKDGGEAPAESESVASSPAIKEDAADAPSPAAEETGERSGDLSAAAAEVLGTDAAAQLAACDGRAFAAKLPDATTAEVKECFEEFNRIVAPMGASERGKRAEVCALYCAILAQRAETPRLEATIRRRLVEFAANGAARRIAVVNFLRLAEFAIGGGDAEGAESDIAAAIGEIAQLADEPDAAVYARFCKAAALRLALAIPAMAAGPELREQIAAAESELPPPLRDRLRAPLAEQKIKQATRTLQGMF